MVGNIGRYARRRGQICILREFGRRFSKGSKFVVASGTRVEEASWDKRSTSGRVESFTPQTAG